MTTETVLPERGTAARPPASRDGLRRSLHLLSRYGTLAGLLVMVVVFSIAAPSSFPTWSNVVNILNQSALTALIAGGLTMALVVGEFDLSIGYAASLAGVLVTGLIVRQGLPVALAVLLVLAVGAVIGVVNGLLVTKARVNAVIATLGVGTILIGLSFG
jgi:ribose transport system permease protein